MLILDSMKFVPDYYVRRAAWQQGDDDDVLDHAVCVVCIRASVGLLAAVYTRVGGQPFVDMTIINSGAPMLLLILRAKQCRGRIILLVYLVIMWCTCCSYIWVEKLALSTGV